MKKIRIVYLSYKRKLMNIILRVCGLFIKDRREVFDIEKEARKLGMTIDEYKTKVLCEKPKTWLNEIYDLYSSDIESVQKEKNKFNNDVKNSKQRQNDFFELDQFVRSLL